VADDPKVPTVSEVSAQLRALVAQTYALVGEIDDVVDTLHEHSDSVEEHVRAFGLRHGGSDDDDGSERNRG